jgi:hypothetical protein
MVRAAGYWGGPKWDLITLYSLVVLKDFGLGPASKQARKMIDRVDKRLAKNIEVERPRMNADSLAELVLTFFTGFSMEQNLSSSRLYVVRKIDDLMNLVPTL